MASESGFSNQKKLGQSQYKTIHGVGSDQYGASVIPKSLFELSGPIAVAIVDSDIDQDEPKYVHLEITAHGAREGDVVKVMSGALAGWEFEIIDIIDANILTIWNIGSVNSVETIPAIADTVKIMRWVTPKADSEGNLNFSPGPMQIMKDGSVVTVTKDTAVPGNTVPVPVELVAASGTPINITAGDINMQLSDLGANFDALRVGDGSGNYAGITANDEIKTHDADALVELQAIGAQLPTALGQDVSANSLPVVLSSEQEQILQDTSDDINQLLTKIPASLGQKSTLQSLAVVLSSNQELLIGDTAEVAPGNDTAAAGLNGRLQRIAQRITSLIALLPASLGQKLMASSLAVTIASDQSSIPVTGPLTDAQLRLTAVPVSGPLTDAQIRASALPVTGPLTDAQLRAAAVPVSMAAAPTGAALETTQSAGNVLIGAVTEAAPATDTASSGLNGRLQRIAQRITSMIALLPASLGQKTMANSLAIVISSDQTAIPVTSTSTPSSVAGAITQAQIVVGVAAVRATVAGTAANAARKKLVIKPSKNNTGSIYLGSSTVTTANGLEIIGPDRLEFEFDAGDYYLISDTAAQVVDIMEKI